MATDEPDDMVLELLRAIRGDIGLLRTDIGELKGMVVALEQHIHAVEHHVIALSTDIGNLNQRQARVEARIP